MCEIDDLDPCEVWSETTRRAAKAHVCDCCGGSIRPGDPYIRHFDVFDHSTASEKLCCACSNSRKIFCEAHFGGRSCSPSNLIELLRDCFAENGDPRWGKMLEAMNLRKELRNTESKQEI